MKILFLDIDGVVNCATTTQRHRGYIGIDPYMAFLVGRIVEQTECEVVLSSTWRLMEEGKEEVERQVVKIHDVTPQLHVGIRGDEIAKWLAEHSDVERYAILDDDSDMREDQQEHFFKTSFATGITEEIAEKVIEHLNK